MFLRLSCIVTIYLIITVRSKDRPCEKWKDHPNFHLVHFGDDCGKVKVEEVGGVSARILNGVKSTAGKLPWMAYVTTSFGVYELYCGGAIINERYILTAAHCVNKDNQTVTVTLGKHNDEKTLKGGWAEKYKVQSIIRNPEYNLQTKRSDIALLRLDRIISFESPYINYICLPASCALAETKFRGESVLMAGWGLTSPSYIVSCPDMVTAIDLDARAESLQQVELVVKKCNMHVRGLNPEDPSQLCTKSRSAMACLGDSGGPLMYFINHTAYEIGISSLSSGNCTAGNFLKNVYTKVTWLMTWILDHIEP